MINLASIVRSAREVHVGSTPEFPRRPELSGVEPVACRALSQGWCAGQDLGAHHWGEAGWGVVWILDWTTSHLLPPNPAVMITVARLSTHCVHASPHFTAHAGPSCRLLDGASLLGAKVGDSLSCFPQGLQQSVHAVLRVDADLFVGQVNVKLNSS